MPFKIRRVTEEDFPWLHTLGRKAYKRGTYDDEAAEKWVASLMKSPNHLVLRGETTWTVAWVQSIPYMPKLKTAHFLIMASFGNSYKELRALNEFVIKWAKENGASCLYWAAINGKDFGPLAMPLGARPVSPSYVLELGDGSKR